MKTQPTSSACLSGTRARSACGAGSHPASAPATFLARPDASGRRTLQVAGAALALICLPGVRTAAKASQPQSPWQKAPWISLSQPEPPSGQFRQLRFSPDGRYILAQDDSRVTLLTSQPFRVLFHVPAEHAALAEFSPGSSEVLFVSAPYVITRHTVFAGSSHLERWSIHNQTRIEFTEIPFHACETTGLSLDGRVLACVDRNGTLQIIDLPSGQTIFEKKKFGQRFVFFNPDFEEFPGFYGNPGIARIDFSPEGRLLIAGPSGDAQGSAIIFDLHERRALALAGELKKLRGGVNEGSVWRFALLASDRVIISSRRPQTASHTVAATLLAFPSGKALSKLRLPPGQLFRAADPHYVLVRPFGRPDPYNPNPKPERAAAVDFGTGLVIISDTPALDVFGTRYVAERAGGEVGLYEIGKGIQATVTIGTAPGTAPRKKQP